jgi:hypothetical protein
MFITHPPFLSRMQFDPNARSWKAVELALNVPWFIVRVADKAAEIYRTFLVHSIDDVEGFVCEASLGEVESVYVALPKSSRFRTEAWEVVQVVALERERVALPGFLPRLIMLLRDGRRFAGHLMEPYQGAAKNRTLVADLGEKII